MSDSAESSSRSLPTDWVRLERAAEEAAVALGRWTRRARESEEEVERLRQSLEDLAAEGAKPDDLEEEVKRLQAENAALKSRMTQARKRITGLMQRLAALEVES